MGIGQVGVDEDENVSFCDEQCFPHRLALAGIGSKVRAYLLVDIDWDAVCGRYGACVVGTVAVHEDDLVEQRSFVHQGTFEGVDDLSNRLSSLSAGRMREIDTCRSRLAWMSRSMSSNSPRENVFLRIQGSMACVVADSCSTSAPRA